MDQIKKFIKKTVAETYSKLGLKPGVSYSQEQIQEAYGNFLLQEMAAAAEDINTDWKYALKYVPGKDGGLGAIFYYGVKANSDTEFQVVKGKVGQEGKTSFYTIEKGAPRKAANEIAWKANKEGWMRVPTLPTDEDSAVMEYGEALGLPTGNDVDALLGARGEAELARRDAAEAEKVARAATRGPRGGHDEGGFSDRKIYGKTKSGAKVHTGLLGGKYVPVDASGVPFDSQFKAGNMVKMKVDPDAPRNAAGKPSRLIVRNQDGSHTQNWGIEENVAKKIHSMIMEEIMKAENKK